MCYIMLCGVFVLKPVAERGLIMEDWWFSMKEICEYLGVSHDTISRWIAKDMPALKMGGIWRFKRAQVDKWLEEGVSKKSKKTA